MGFPLLIVVAIVALVVGGVWYSNKLQKQRTAELAQVAQAMKFSFFEAGTPEIEARMSAFPLCNVGRSRRWRNVMAGKTADRDAVLGEYEYVTGGGKNRHTWHQTVAVFPSGVGGLPDFTLAPENFFHRIGQVFGYQDIDFEASEEFSKHYLLRGPDETAIRRAFNADAISFFARSPGWSVQVCNGNIAVFRSDKRSKPAEVPAFLADALRIQDAFARG